MSLSSAFGLARRRLDDEARHEIDTHVEFLTDRYVGSGMSPDEARPRRSANRQRLAGARGHPRRRTECPGSTACRRISGHAPRQMRTPARLRRRGGAQLSLDRRHDRRLQRRPRGPADRFPAGARRARAAVSAGTGGPTTRYVPDRVCIFPSLRDARRLFADCGARVLSETGVDLVGRRAPNGCGCSGVERLFRCRCGRVPALAAASIAATKPAAERVVLSDTSGAPTSPRIPRWSGPPSA